VSLLWERLLLSLIGEKFGDDNDYLIGGILSIRSRETILEIWFCFEKKSEFASDLKMRLVCLLKRLLMFNDEHVVYFKDNELSIKQKSTIRDAEMYSFQEKK
jgi:hypothetical protein